MQNLLWILKVERLFRHSFSGSRGLGERSLIYPRPCFAFAVSLQDGTRSVHSMKLSGYVSGAELVTGDHAALRVCCVVGNGKQLISIHTCSGLSLPEAWTGRSGSPEEVRPSALPSLSPALWGRLQPVPGTQNRNIASSRCLRVNNSKALGSLVPRQDYRLARLAP